MSSSPTASFTRHDPYRDKETRGDAADVNANLFTEGSPTDQAPTRRHDPYNGGLPRNDTGVSVGGSDLFLGESPIVGAPNDPFGGGDAVNPNLHQFRQQQAEGLDEVDIHTQTTSSPSATMQSQGPPDLGTFSMNHHPPSASFGRHDPYGQFEAPGAVAAFPGNTGTFQAATGSPQASFSAGGGLPSASMTQAVNSAAKAVAGGPGGSFTTPTMPPGAPLAGSFTVPKGALGSPVLPRNTSQPGLQVLTGFAGAPLQAGSPHASASPHGGSASPHSFHSTSPVHNFQPAAPLLSHSPTALPQSAPFGVPPIQVGYSPHLSPQMSPTGSPHAQPQVATNPYMQHMAGVPVTADLAMSRPLEVVVMKNPNDALGVLWSRRSLTLSRVNPNTPAAMCGLDACVGLTLTKVDDVPVSKFKDFTTLTQGKGHFKLAFERTPAGNNQQNQNITVAASNNAKPASPKGPGSPNMRVPPAPPTPKELEGQVEASKMPTAVRVMYKYGRVGEVGVANPVQAVMSWVGQAWLVEAAKGLDLCEIVSARPNNDHALQYRLCRPATKEEQDRSRVHLVAQEHEALRFVADKAKRLKAKVQIHACEFQLDKMKLTIHYSSTETKPDFRQLVHETFKEFQIRIWMNNCKPSDGQPGDALDPAKLPPPPHGGGRPSPQSAPRKNPRH